MNSGISRRIITFKTSTLNSLTNRSFTGSLGAMPRLPLLAILLLAIQTTWAQTDSTIVKNDTVAWNKSLDGVTVTAQRQLIKQEIDRIGYDVQADEDSKTENVLDMLRKVPMVTVDGQDNITVNGSSSFKVYVDGKPNVMFSSNASMIFKSMPAVAVKSIEVVTNPGAKYDAEGASGVLNIVLNKQLTGGDSASMNSYSGTLRAQAGTNGWGGGAFLSGQQGKLSYSANAMQSYMKPGTPKVSMEMVFLLERNQRSSSTRVPHR